MASRNSRQVRGMISSAISTDATASAAGPAGPGDDHGRDDDRRRSGEVAEDLEIGAADVQALAWASRSRNSETAFATRPRTPTAT